jgi:hypothetical protein
LILEGNKNVFPISLTTQSENGKWLKHLCSSGFELATRHRKQKGSRKHPMLSKQADLMLLDAHTTHTTHSQTNQNDNKAAILWTNLIISQTREYNRAHAHLLKQDSFQYLTSFQAQKANLHSAVSVQHLLATR